MKKYKTSAFTLVELIVVITILAILGTIAFINLQGYSTSARDSKRLSDINNIQKKITIEESKGTTLSSLINTVKTNSGLTIDGNNAATSIQGTANFQTLKENGESFKDPVTKGDYILSYSIGGTGTGAYKFTQISTINEENNQAVVKGNYYPMQSGDSPSITVNSEDYYVVDAGVDLPYLAVAGGGGSSSSSSSSGGPVVLKTVSNCGTTVGEIIYGTTDGTYTGLTCANDIIVCNGTTGSGYTISSCNEGASIVGTGTGSYGGLYQWGNNYDFRGGQYTNGNIYPTISATRVGATTSDSIYSNATFIASSSLPSPYDWTSIQNDNLWGNGTNTSIARKGPCATGYHVPTQTEWSGIVTAGGWGSNGTAMQTALKLPYAGYRYWDNGALNNGASFGYYWSGTPGGTDGYRLNINSSSINPSSNRNRAYGFSVRCFKN